MSPRALHILIFLLGFVLAAQAATPAKRLPALKPEDAPEDPVEKDDKGGLGNDIKRMGESVASRVDRVIKKKSFDLWGDPWTMQGLPLIFPGSQTGFNLGLKVAIQDVIRQDPHKFELETQILASDRGRYKHFLKLDAPHAFDGRVRITGKIQYDRDISLPYFGIGNESPIDPAEYAKDDLGKYQNVRAGPSVRLDVLRYVGKNVRLGPVVQLKWQSITAPAGSLLADERPAGVNGGRTHTVGFAIIHDTLDFEPYPSRGSVHELYLQLASGFTGSDYNFFRGTYTYRRYYLLHRKLIFAHRFLFESLTGNVPFYELDSVGGSSPTLTFGGGRFLRGFEPNRFIDKQRMAFGFELRWDPVFFPFAKQDITIGFVPFFDLARVWAQMLPFKPGQWHADAGWGARIIWNSRLIIRGDFAVTEEGTYFYVDLGHNF